MAEYYEWEGENAIGVETHVSFRKYYWDELEPQPGVYDFSKMRLHYLWARARGKMFAFHVRAAGEGGDYHCPYPVDWAGAQFLDKAEALLLMLGKEFDDPEHIAWVRVGLLGDHGEWTGMDMVPEDLRYEIMKLTVRMYERAFLHAQLTLKADAPRPVLEWAYEIYPDLGWHMNALGAPPQTKLLAANWDLLRGRFSAAEFKNPKKMQEAGYSYVTALEQVRAWGLDYVSSGNLPAWDGLPLDQQAALLEIACG